MKTYELTCIISPEASADDCHAKVKEIESFIQANEGSILKLEGPSAKALAYRIKKQGSGFFVVAEFTIPEAKAKELKQKLGETNLILRYMLVTKPPVRQHKARRTRKPAPVFDQDLFQPQTKKEVVAPVESKPTKEKEKEKGKADLNDIEKQLDEILGE